MPDTTTDGGAQEEVGAIRSSGALTSRCPDCAGEGEIFAYRDIDDGPMDVTAWPCAECHATGYVAVVAAPGGRRDPGIDGEDAGRYSRCGGSAFGAGGSMATEPTYEQFITSPRNRRKGVLSEFLKGLVAGVPARVPEPWGSDGIAKSTVYVSATRIYGNKRVAFRTIDGVVWACLLKPADVEAQS